MIVEISGFCTMDSFRLNSHEFGHSELGIRCYRFPPLLSPVVFLFAIIFCSSKYLVLCFISVVVSFPLCLIDLLYFILIALYSDARTSFKRKNSLQTQNHSSNQTTLMFPRRSCSSQRQMAHCSVLSCCNFVQMSQEKDRGEILLLTTGGNGCSCSDSLYQACWNKLWQYVFFPITLKYCKFLFNKGLAENFPSALILDDFHLSCMRKKT